MMWEVYCTVSTGGVDGSSASWTRSLRVLVGLSFDHRIFITRRVSEINPEDDRPVEGTGEVREWFP